MPEPMDGPLPTISVVMPTFNRRARLREVVAPLLADDAAQEIIVVVDGCDDGSIELLRDLAADTSRLVPLSIDNAGEMAARQAGIRRATSDVVLLLDDDVLADPGLVAGHARVHGGRPGSVVVGYMPTRLPRLRRAGDAATFLYAAEYERECRRYEADAEAILLGLWAGNVSLRREDALRVGLPSADFGGIRYHPDMELGLRLKRAGLTDVFDRRLRAEHRHERSLAAFRRDAKAQGAGRVRLHELHADLIGELPADAFLDGLPRWVIALARRRRSRRWMAEALAIAARACGTLRFFAGESLALRLIRRLDQQSGALELLAGAPA